MSRIAELEARIEKLERFYPKLNIEPRKARKNKDEEEIKHYQKELKKSNTLKSKLTQ